MRPTLAIALAVIAGCAAAGADPQATAAQTSSSCVRTLAGGGPRLTANRHWVFWETDDRGPGRNDQAVFRVPRAGGIVREIARASDDSFGSLRADGFGVWFTTFDAHGEQTLRYVTRDGVTRGAVGVGRNLDAVDAAHLYSVFEPDASGAVAIRRTDRTLAGWQDVTTTAGPVTALALGASYLYFLEGATIEKVSKTGGTARPLWTAPAGRPVQLVIVHGVLWTIVDHAGTPETQDVTRVDAVTGDAAPVLHLEGATDARLYAGPDAVYLVRAASLAGVSVARLDADGTLTADADLQDVLGFQIDDSGALWYKDGQLWSRPSTCP